MLIGFTVVEGVVGTCLIIGISTRIMGLGVFMLAFGILLSTGWLGTTCLVFSRRCLRSVAQQIRGTENRGIRGKTAAGARWDADLSAVLQ